jgi:ubiquitin-activating enzyme E1
VLHGAITEQIIQQFTVFVVTDFFERASLIAWNDFCRKNGIAFIYAGSLGLYGFTFVDFGDKHTIIDKDGEENRSAIIAFIS